MSLLSSDKRNVIIHEIGIHLTPNDCLAATPIVSTNQVDEKFISFN